MKLKSTGPLLSYAKLNEIFTFLNSLEREYQDFLEKIDYECNKISKKRIELMNTINECNNEPINCMNQDVSYVIQEKNIPYICNPKVKLAYSLGFSKSVNSPLKVQPPKPPEDNYLETAKMARILKKAQCDEEKKRKKRLCQEYNVKMSSSDKCSLLPSEKQTKVPIIKLSRLSPETLRCHGYALVEQRCGHKEWVSLPADDIEENQNKCTDILQQDKIDINLDNNFHHVEKLDRLPIDIIKVDNYISIEKLEKCSKSHNVPIIANNTVCNIRSSDMNILIDGEEKHIISQKSACSNAKKYGHGSKLDPPMLLQPKDVLNKTVHRCQRKSVGSFKRTDRKSSNDWRQSTSQESIGDNNIQENNTSGNDAENQNSIVDEPTINGDSPPSKNLESDFPVQYGNIKLKPCSVVLPRLKFGFRGFPCDASDKNQYEIVHRTSITQISFDLSQNYLKPNNLLHCKYHQLNRKTNTILQESDEKENINRTVASSRKLLSKINCRPLRTNNNPDIYSICSNSRAHEKTTARKSIRLSCLSGNRKVKPPVWAPLIRKTHKRQSVAPKKNFSRFAAFRKFARLSAPSRSDRRSVSSGSDSSFDGVCQCRRRYIQEEPLDENIPEWARESKRINAAKIQSFIPMKLMREYMGDPYFDYAE